MKKKPIGCGEVLLYTFGVYTILAYMSVFSYWHTFPLLAGGTVLLALYRSYWHAIGFVTVHLLFYLIIFAMGAYWLVDMALARVYSMLAPLQPTWRFIQWLRSPAVG